MRSGLGVALVAAVAQLALAASASAHFQMIYPGTSARMANSPALDLLIIFTHPFNGQPTMNMEMPKSFYVVSQRGEARPKKEDLLKTLTPFPFAMTDGKPNSAFRATLPAAAMRSVGDYVFVLEPQPFYEASEDKYIQQYTKMIANVGGVPGNWDDAIGLPAEIKPLSKPYANWTGGVFRGVVLGNGKPVPFAEIEFEYVTRTPDADKHDWVGDRKATAPHPALGAASIRADATGAFTIGLPKAGWWGIAALNVGPVKKFKGKPLSQDAVIWVEVTDIK